MFRLGFSWKRYFRGVVANVIELNILDNHFSGDMEMKK
jgi:hypothetical protein